METTCHHAVAWATVEGMMKTREAVMKTCTKCGETKPLGMFSKDKSRRDGLRSYCKACGAESCRRWREANAEAVREYDRRYYEANAEAVREYSRRYHEANAEAKREYNRRYYEANAEAAREYARRYHEANPEAVRECNRRWREANAEAVRERKRRYREANLEAERERDRRYREANAEARREYRQQNRPLYNAHSARRRATNLQRTMLWADVEFIASVYRVRALASRVFDEEYHVDHVVPLQGRKVSGLHVRHNLQILPAIVNVRKSNRLDERLTLDRGALARSLVDLIRRARAVRA